MQRANSNKVGSFSFAAITITSILPRPQPSPTAREGTRVSLSRPTPPDTTCGSQAVRSLGPLRSTCYQACTRGLSTTSSGCDLDPLSQEHGKPRLVGGFALRCFQRFSFLDVATQLWPGQANWLTSGPAISVLSYWR